MDSLNQIIILSSIELRKTYSQKKYQILLFAAAATGIVLAWAGMSVQTLPFTVLSLITVFLAPLAAMMLASDLVAGEVAQNEMKVLLYQPVERYHLISAKIIAVALYCGSLLAAAGTVSAVISAVFAGVDGISLFNILSAYVLSVIPLLTLSALFVLLSIISRSPSASFGSALFVYIGLMAAGIVFPGAASLLPTSYISIGTMVIGSRIPVGSLLTGVVLLTGYGCISFCLSGLIFQKKDFM